MVQLEIRAIALLKLQRRRARENPVEVREHGAKEPPKKRRKNKKEEGGVGDMGKIEGTKTTPNLRYGRLVLLHELPTL